MPIVIQFGPVFIHFEKNETFLTYESMRASDRRPLETAGFQFNLASENIRCNLAFFPNITHGYIARHASKLTPKQI